MPRRRSVISNSLLLVGIAGALGGCAVIQARQVDDQLSLYQGRSVALMAMQYGPPDLQYDVSPGRRIYQWRRSGETNPGYWVFKTDEPVRKTDCRISVVASTFDAGRSLEDWRVDRWYYEGEGCV